MKSCLVLPSKGLSTILLTRTQIPALAQFASAAELAALCQPQPQGAADLPQVQEEGSAYNIELATEQRAQKCMGIPHLPFNRTNYLSRRLLIVPIASGYLLILKDSIHVNLPMLDLPTHQVLQWSMSPRNFNSLFP